MLKKIQICNVNLFNRKTIVKYKKKIKIKKIIKKNKIKHNHVKIIKNNINN